VNVELKIIRGLIELLFRYIWLSEQSKTCKTLVRVSDIPAEIAIGQFLCKIQEGHRLSIIACLFSC